MIRFAESAQAALGRPVDALVPLMRRHRAWWVAGIAAYALVSIIAAALGVHGFLRWALGGAAAGLALTALTRQHLLVRVGDELWLIAARPFRSRPDLLVGAVDRSDVTTADGKYNDELRIGETSYVLPRLFREQAKEVLAGPAEIDDPPSPG
jgi:hypothetical protein